MTLVRAVDLCGVEKAPALTVDPVLLAARVAAQFAREDESELGDRIAADAVSVAQACRRIKVLPRGSSRRAAAIDDLKAVCEKYGAKVVLADDLLGMTVGLRFSKGRYRAGLSSIFHLI